MPDISKINALAIGSVSKVDGLAKASILDIDGVAVPSAFTPLLDTYTGAVAAYSVRQLKTGVTIAMRVRRDTAGGTGDDDEADVALDTTLSVPTISLDSAVSNFSTTSNATNLGQFLNATGYTDADSLTVVADGYVDEWKDQSGSGNDAEQTVFSEQPQIFDSASPTDLIKTNNEPSIYFDDTLNNNLVTPSDSWTTAGDTTIFCAWNKNLAAGAREVWSNAATRWFGGTGQAQVYVAPSALNYTAVEVQHLFTYEHRDGVSKSVYIDGSQDATSATPGAVPSTASIARIGRRYNTAESWVPMYQQELIVYPSDKSSNRADIESDINGFFSIY